MPRTPSAGAASPWVLIAGEDSWRADRALERVLATRAKGLDPADFTRLWGDECAFDDVVAAANSRSLFSPRTVVIVRRAEKLRGVGAVESEEAGDGSTDGPAAEAGSAEEPADGSLRAKGRKAPPAPDLPEIDGDALVVLVARKPDRRRGLWRKLSNAAQVEDAAVLKGRQLNEAAAAEASRLKVRLPYEALRDLVEQCGPELGRIVSEIEKIALYGAGSSDDLLATTGGPPPWAFTDALASRSSETVAHAHAALEQGEPALMLLSMAHRALRRTLVFGALRGAGTSSAEAAKELGLMPFKVADTEEAARAWDRGSIAVALQSLSECDRVLKLSSPPAPALLLATARATMPSRGRVRRASR